MSGVNLSAREFGAGWGPICAQVDLRLLAGTHVGGNCSKDGGPAVDTADLDRTGVLDEAYERLSSTGPEFEGFLSNHGPMASEALVQLGLGEHVHRWLDSYVDKLEERPKGSEPITPEESARALGDANRFGDWLDYFEIQVRERDWRDVLAQWWPRLLPGSLASASHSLIRVGHAVRALQAIETPARSAELGQALGYWAARYLAIPAIASPAGQRTATEALDAVTRVGDQTGRGRGPDPAVGPHLGMDRGLAAGRVAAAHGRQLIPTNA